MRRIIAFLLLFVALIGTSACEGDSAVMGQLEWVERMLTDPELEISLDQIPQEKRAFVEGLMELRREYPAIAAAADAHKATWVVLSEQAPGVRVSRLRGRDAKGVPFSLLWLVNETDELQQIKIPNGYYQVLCYQFRVGEQQLGVVHGKLAYVPSKSAMIIKSGTKFE